MKKIILILIVSICFIVLVACGAPNPPVKSDLIYDPIKTLNNGSCGAENPCVDFQGKANFTIDATSPDIDFDYDASSEITLSIGTTSYILPGEPPIPIELIQVDYRSIVVPNHRWFLTLENPRDLSNPQNDKPKNIFVFKITPSSKPALTVGNPIMGKYILSGRNIARSATLQITAKKNVTGALKSRNWQN